MALPFPRPTLTCLRLPLKTSRLHNQSCWDTTVTQAARRAVGGRLSKNIKRHGHMQNQLILLSPSNAGHHTTLVKSFCSSSPRYIVVMCCMTWHKIAQQQAALLGILHSHHPPEAPAVCSADCTNRISGCPSICKTSPCSLDLKNNRSTGHHVTICHRYVEATHVASGELLPFDLVIGGLTMTEHATTQKRLRMGCVVCQQPRNLNTILTLTPEGSFSGCVFSTFFLSRLAMFCPQFGPGLWWLVRAKLLLICLTKRVQNSCVLASGSFGINHLTLGWRVSHESHRQNNKVVDNRTSGLSCFC